MPVSLPIWRNRSGVSAPLPSPGRTIGDAIELIATFVSRRFVRTRSTSSFCIAGVKAVGFAASVSGMASTTAAGIGAFRGGPAGAVENPAR